MFHLLGTLMRFLLGNKCAARSGIPQQLGRSARAESKVHGARNFCSAVGQCPRRLFVLGIDYYFCFFFSISLMRSWTHNTSMPLLSLIQLVYFPE